MGLIALADQTPEMPPETLVAEAVRLMTERNVGSVVLVKDGRPVGFVTDRDLTVSVLADGREPNDRAEDHASAPVTLLLT